MFQGQPASRPEDTAVGRTAGSGVDPTLGVAGCLARSLQAADPAAAKLIAAKLAHQSPRRASAHRPPVTHLLVHRSGSRAGRDRFRRRGEVRHCSRGLDNARWRRPDARLPRKPSATSRPDGRSGPGRCLPLLATSRHVQPSGGRTRRRRRSSPVGATPRTSISWEPLGVLGCAVGRTFVLAFPARRVAQTDLADLA
jgi:hypothetical protein